jgi:hypothetical protein
MPAVPSAQQSIRRCVGIAMVALLCAHVATVAAQDRGERARRFEADQRACQDGKSGQAFEPCMKEARAVQAQRLDSTPSADAEQLRRNGLMRCDALKGDDRVACDARMRGEGTVSGSVAGGGILRELITTDAPDGAPPKPAPAESVHGQ